MKSLDEIFNNPRVTKHQRGDDGGAMQVRLKGNALMFAVVSIGGGWDHVSAQTYDRGRDKMRIPTWDEMELIKRYTFKDDETAMQLHVPPNQHINLHNNVLHLWRPHHGQIATPPDWMV